MKKIAIIIRGKAFEDHSPDIMDQHADMVLSSGEPFGYFGSGGFSPRSGMFMEGIIFNYYDFSSFRPEYINAEFAKKIGIKSTLCSFEIEDEKAAKFDSFWINFRKDLNNESRDSTFHFLGNNCSSFASKALRHAGIVDKGIPGLDTPDNLYHQLKVKFGNRFQCVSGHIGFKLEQSKFTWEVIE